MSHFVYEESAVAFLDVLGFKNLIADAEKSPSAFQSLVGLLTVLDAHVKWDNVGLAPSVPDKIKPHYIFISDSIILSAPLQYRNYDGLEIVVLEPV